MAKLNLKDFKKSGEAPFDLEEKDFTDPNTLIGKEIDITGVIKFESAKGPGMFIKFNFPGEEIVRYTTTHSIGVMSDLDNEDLLGLLKGGAVLPVKVNRRASKKDASKTIWELLPVE